MKRNPLKIKWTKAYMRLHGKDMTEDTTFEFERKKNSPERYDRNLAASTLKAIKKIDKIRTDRGIKHIEKRKMGKKTKEHKEAGKEYDQAILLVQEPSTTLQKIKVTVQQQQAEENKAMEE